MKKLRKCTGKWGCGEVKLVELFDDNCYHCIECRKKRIRARAARHNEAEFDVEFTERFNRLWRATG